MVSGFVVNTVPGSTDTLRLHDIVMPAGVCTLIWTQSRFPRFAKNNALAVLREFACLRIGLYRMTPLTYFVMLPLAKQLARSNLPEGQLSILSGYSTPGAAETSAILYGPYNLIGNRG